MKTMATTEAVSSVGMEKRVERHICQRSAPVIREKPMVDWKMDLQYCGTGRKSGKHPTLVVGKKPYGKSQFKRLYWAGYQGRMATFDWPCGHFPPNGVISPF